MERTPPERAAQREETMNEPTTITPHLTCRDAKAAIEFYKKAFGAEAPCAMETPDGRIMHAAITIDGASVYIVEEFPEYGGTSPQALGGTPVSIHMQVADADAVFAKAVEAGCTVAMPLGDMFWGDRYGIVADPFGHKWSIATTKRIVSPEEIRREMAGAAV